VGGLHQVAGFSRMQSTIAIQQGDDESAPNQRRSLVEILAPSMPIYERYWLYRFSLLYDEPGMKSPRPGWGVGIFVPVTFMAKTMKNGHNKIDANMS
jgi:hypothetical protein